MTPITAPMGRAALKIPMMRARRRAGYTALTSAAAAPEKPAIPIPTRVRGMKTPQKFWPRLVMYMNTLQNTAIPAMALRLLHRSTRYELGKENAAMLSRKAVWIMPAWVSLKPRSFFMGSRATPNRYQLIKYIISSKLQIKRV